MQVDFADYGIYGDDVDPRIDLRNPHFRQDPPPMHMHAQDFYGHPQHHHPHHNPFAAHHLAGLAVDVKPRLTKEQHDVLEAHYQQQNKPNTQTKKSFAESLGVSLDKVNNWFQNRRAKSKQDAKKAAGQLNMMQNNNQQPQQNQSQSQQQSQNQNISNDDLSSQFLSSEFFSSHNHSNSGNSDTLSLNSGLGIRQAEQTSDNFAPTTMAPSDMLKNAPVHALKNDSVQESETHRRTLTQEEFDAFAHNGDYIPGAADSATTIQESPAQSQNGEFLKDYFPELDDFSFENQLNEDSLGPIDMQPAFSHDSYGSTFSEAPSGSTVASTADADCNPSTHSSLSDWSEHSTPSLSVTPAHHQADSGYAASDCEISPRAKVPSKKTSTTWQPGQSVPVDFAAIDREFREAAMRSAQTTTASGHNRRSSSQPCVEQPLAFPNDQTFTQAEPASLTQSIGNLGITSEQNQVEQQPKQSQPIKQARRTPSLQNMSGGIAARRQRPRPQPLSSSSLRSTSYCGSLPIATALPTNSANLAPTAPTLRRIKSSNVMNGIASGRIQKNIGVAQRSPLNFTFAEAINSPKFARSVSNYSPANSGLGPSNANNLAPPTPLSPGEMSSSRPDLQRQWAQMVGGQHMSRQPSINESLDEEPGHLMHVNTVPSNNFSSPPTTPLYPTQFARNRMAGGMMMSENTPPQSAPATQACFSNAMFTQAPHMQNAHAAAMLQAQSQSFVPVMSNEYPQMPNVVLPSQQMSPGPYMDVAAQYAAMGMVPPSQPMQLNYPNMAFAQGLGPQSLTPPHHQFMVPSSPGVLLSSQSHHGGMQSKSLPQADFCVLEYSPPQDLKRSGSPRKTVDNGPRSYTFSNHGPEHFEKGKGGKANDVTGSPGSSTGGSSTG